MRPSSMREKSRSAFTSLSNRNALRSTNSKRRRRNWSGSQGRRKRPARRGGGSHIQHQRSRVGPGGTSSVGNQLCLPTIGIQRIKKHEWKIEIVLGKRLRS